LLLDLEENFTALSSPSSKMQPEELIGRKKKPEEDEEIPPTPAAYASESSEKGENRNRL
jgi:hypothetical protein